MRKIDIRSEEQEENRVIFVDMSKRMKSHVQGQDENQILAGTQVQPHLQKQRNAEEAEADTFEKKVQSNQSLLNADYTSRYVDPYSADITMHTPTDVIQEDDILHYQATQNNVDRLKTIDAWEMEAEQSNQPYEETYDPSEIKKGNSQYEEDLKQSYKFIFYTMLITCIDMVLIVLLHNQGNLFEENNVDTLNLYLCIFIKYAVVVHLGFTLLMAYRDKKKYRSNIYQIKREDG